MIPQQRASPRSPKPFHLLAFFGLFTVPLIFLHAHLLTLPYFWDELGQFVPTALDLLRHGWWVAHSTLPNVHPPGVEVYLVLWYRLFGYSIAVTRLAMLLVAGAGLLFTFLLAIELSRGTKGAPAFLPPLLLLASPLFYMQSMMAQLDMPAMVLTILALLLFVSDRLMYCAAACVALVLVKETGLVVPAIFGAVLLTQGHWRKSLLFLPSALALGAWLLLLHAKTGYWLGNPDFAHYNVGYALQPVRVLFSLARRIYYLFFAEFRWIGTLILVLTARKCKSFRSPVWRVTILASAATLVLVSVLGGAELERYLLPVLPVFYIAVAVAATQLPNRIAIPAVLALLIGLAVNLFWNPPYPFPYENNYAMVDFVRLQQAAAAYTESMVTTPAVATAWPFSEALRDPDYGYVRRGLKVIETNDFHLSSLEKLPDRSYGILITYTRTWMPNNGVIAFAPVKAFLQRYYDWEPAADLADCEALGLEQAAQWSRRGQKITVYVRPSQR